jgi:hypothetical protein
MARVYLGCPTYDGWMIAGAARAFYAWGSRQHEIIAEQPNPNSLLPDACDSLWGKAITCNIKYGAQWFAMIHADVEPEQWWIDKLIAEAELHNADFLSAIIPIKSDKGLTSTSIAYPQGSRRSGSRLTLKQVNHNNFPKTVDIHAAVKAVRSSIPAQLQIQADETFLLCNTGCMVCRLDRPWRDPGKVHFQILNTLSIDDDGESTFSSTLSEDWFFTRAIAQAGGKVMATKALQVMHYDGLKGYFSRDSYGQDREDWRP